MEVQILSAAPGRDFEFKPTPREASGRLPGRSGEPRGKVPTGRPAARPSMMSKEDRSCESFSGAVSDRRTTPLEEACAHFRLDRLGMPVSPATLRLYDHTIGRFCAARMNDVIPYDLPMEGYGGAAAQPELAEREARALFESGRTQMAEGKLGAASEAFDQIVQRYGDETELQLRVIVANSLNFRAITLDQRGRWEQAVAAFDEVERRYRDAVDPEFRVVAASALSGRMDVLIRHDQRAEAVEASNLMVERYGQAADPLLRQLAAWALFNLGGQLIARWRQPAAAIEAFDWVVERCGQAAEPDLRALTAMALVGKGAALAMQGDTGEADAASALVLERYGDSADPKLREIVAMALQNLARGRESVPFRPIRLDATGEAGWYSWVKRMITRWR